MLTLGIETTGRFCAAAIFNPADARIAAEISRGIGRGHSEAIVGIIEAALQTAGAGWRDLRRIAVASGPGSFTGIRAGVAAARGLALALGVEAVGIGVLEALAAEAPGGSPVLAAIAARDGLVFFQGFDAAGEPVAPASCDTPKQAAGFLVSRLAADAILCGDAAEQVIAAGAMLRPVAHRLGEPTAGRIARLGAVADPARHPPVPAYVNPPGAKPQARAAVRLA